MPPRGLALLSALITLAIFTAPASAAPKKVAFKFSATTYSVAESAGTFNVTVTRSGNTSSAASIAYSDNGTGTAASGTDYSFTAGTLNFAAGQTSKTFPVTIADNATANAPNKTIVFKLANATPAGSQIKTPTSTLTIIDNEGPGTLDFSSGSYTVLEGAGAATVTVNRLGATNLKLSVDYATLAAATSPATPTSDYAPISPARTLTFNAGEVTKTFQVAIADDADAEGAENVALVLSNPKNLTAGAAPQIGPNGPAQLTINDDDVSTFAFSVPEFSVREDAASGHATITVNRSGATNVAGSVDYATSDGTATGADYTAASGTLAFAAGETTKTFDVVIANDGTAEANETVNLRLSSGGSTVATSLLSIVDNDNPKASVQLSSPVYDVDESDGTATVTVTLSHAVDADVTVAYATADATGLAGSDYADTHGTLTFTGNVNSGGAGGQTAKTIEIPILQDTDAEDPETLTLALSNALPGASSVLGAPATGTITIADDDPPGAIDFKALRYDVGEAAGQATVTVERVGGVGGAVSIDYQTSDGSATAGADYTTTAGTLTWAAGDGDDKTFTVPIAWDGRAEGTESINLALTNPGGGADPGPSSAAVVRIGDDGASGPLALSAAAYRVGEADGLVTLAVKRSGGSLGGPVSVDYATSDGTATAGSDYVAAAGTLTFAPGEAEKSVTVHVTSDAAHEGDETLQLKLAGASGGASLGSPAGATVTIADDDAESSAPPSSSDAPPAGSGPIPVMADKTAPKLTVAAKKLQRALKAKRLALKARCDEGCKLVAVAKLTIGKRKVTLGRATGSSASGKTARIKVKLTRKALGTLRTATSRGTAKVVLSVRATDAAGNRTAKSRRVAVGR